MPIRTRPNGARLRRESVSRRLSTTDTWRPTTDFEGHRTRLRQAFGHTMSDEFVDVMLGKVVEALRPSPFDQLEEATFNACSQIWPKHPAAVPERGPVRRAGKQL